MKNFHEKHYKNTFIKYLVIAWIAWTLLIICLAVINIKNEGDTSTVIVTHTARSSLAKDKMFRLWATSHGGVYVTATERTPPNPYLEHIPERDIITSKGKKLTLMNPAYMLSQMMREYEGLYGAKGHITSLNVLNPKNAPDAWEIEQLKLFEKGEKEVYDLTSKNNIESLRMMKPLITKKGCLKCHGHQGYTVGDVRGGVSLSVPMLKYRELEHKVIKNIIISLIALWGIGLLFILIFINKLQTIIKQRIELQQVSGRHELLAKHHEELREAHGKVETQNKLLEEFSNTDALTLIANRRYFDSILERECGRLSRDKTSLSLSLIMCDIDYFKEYNDTYGHQKGDDCLQHIAGAIRSVVRRATDCVARYGGEEFAIILPGVESDDVMQLAETARKAIENLHILHDSSEVDTIVTLSFGVASITNQDKKLDCISTLVSRADKALYMAKTSGRNKVVQSKIT